MNNRHRTAALLAAAFVVAASSMAAEAPAASRAPAAAQDRQLAESYLGWMHAVFAVPDTPDIDPPLRAAVKALADEHLARLRTRLPAWIGEERARAGATVSPNNLDRAIHNRLVNEIALWRLESPGAAYDAVLVRAILRPGRCDLPERDSYLGQLVTLFQAVPPADRPTLLAGERELLARWGTRRAAIAPRPQPSLAEAETAEVARLRSGESTPDVAMPPFLANALFKGEPLSLEAKCAVHQWGLARALHRGDDPAGALLAWRYATLWSVEDWNWPTPPKERPEPGAYPFMAMRWGVEGWVDVRAPLDAQGRFGRPVVVGRQLSVPGVHDNPAVAFDTLLDPPSLVEAPQRYMPVKPAADGSRPKDATVRINWKLQ